MNNIFFSVCIRNSPLKDIAYIICFCIHLVYLRVCHRIETKLARYFPDPAVVAQTADQHRRARCSCGWCVWRLRKCRGANTGGMASTNIVSRFLSHLFRINFAYYITMYVATILMKIASARKLFYRKNIKVLELRSWSVVSTYFCENLIMARKRGTKFALHTILYKILLTSASRYSLSSLIRCNLGYGQSFDSDTNMMRHKIKERLDSSYICQRVH